MSEGREMSGKSESFIIINGICAASQRSSTQRDAKQVGSKRFWEPPAWGATVPFRVAAPLPESLHRLNELAIEFRK